MTSTVALKDRCLMTWEGSKSRWRKMYKGKLYFVSCHQLGARPTKDASYQAANAWWQAKLAEVRADAPAHPHATIKAELERRRDWAKRYGDDRTATRLSDSLADLDSLQPGDLPDLMVRDMYLGSSTNQMLWSDRFEREHEAAVPTETTIGGLAGRYYGNFEARYRAGDLSPGEFDLTRRCVGHFVDWIGPGNPPEVVTPERWEGYWKHLLGRVADGQIGVVYAKKDWAYARRFIRWMASMGLMALPANIDNRAYRFGDGARAIPTFTVDEARELVREAPGQLKLHVLLMLNCGFYQSDISSLLHSEVDWEAGTITRKRTKTRKHHGKAVPTVMWRLWPITFALLEEHRSGHPTLALTTQRGKPWVEERIVGEKVKSRDAIQANYRHVQRRLGQEKPLKVLRKTSASSLDNHDEYGRYAQFFLGQAPDGMTARHYVVPSQERFDAAVLWLGQKYGFVESQSGSVFPGTS